MEKQLSQYHAGSSESMTFQVSRRDFLKIAGITTTLAAMPTAISAILASAGTHGRMLHLTDLYERPALDAKIAGQYLPDSIQPILAYRDGWVRLRHGFAPETNIQPMLTARTTRVDRIPAVVEVIAPYAAVRRWCAADAPLVARPGHGAVLEAVSALDDRYGDRWLQVALSEASNGWIQAQQVQPVEPIPASRQAYHARIENHRLTLLSENHDIAQFALACPPDIPTGEHRVIQRIPAFHRADYSGIPWRLETNRGLVVHGAYWHNQFACRNSESMTAELSVIAARSVYMLLSEGSSIFVG